MKEAREKRQSRRWKRRQAVFAYLFFCLIMAFTGCGQEKAEASKQKEKGAEETEFFQADMLPSESSVTGQSGQAGTDGNTEEQTAEEKAAQEQTAEKRETGESAAQEGAAKEGIQEKKTAEKGLRESVSDESGAEGGGTDRKKEASAVPGGLPALSVKGTNLVDPAGNPVVLRGISTHGLAWYPGYVNEDCFAQLKEEWGINVVRLAMYTAESGGYCTDGDQDKLKALVRDGVAYAEDCGLYVIIDWHILSDGNPNTHLEEAKVFFDEMSREYADSANVIYEICNEPNGGVSWSDVKAYAEQIIDVIRENDEDGVVLVGTPNWCQYLDQAAADPITGRENVMYTLHFYAATHKESLRKVMVDAIEAGLPVFVSEYSICDASGNGGIDWKEADEWVRVLEEYGVSYVAWNLSNKGETSALLKSSCKKESGFDGGDLSETGKWLYGILTGESAERAGSSWSKSRDETQDREAGATRTPEGGQSGGESQPPQGDGADREAATVFSGGNGLEIAAELVNSWEQDGRDCLQYTLTITNAGDAACSGWTVELDFGGEITLSDGWNGNYQVSGSRLTISSMDYNGSIAAGDSVKDVGFIVSGEKGVGL